MINLKPHRQKPAFCGPASLKMVFGYYGIKKSETELARLCGTDPENGTRAHRMVATAKQCGLQSFFKDNTSLAELRKWVEGKGVPVIVNWFSVDEGHYSPVVAVTDKTITLMDPELGRARRMTLEKFLGVWFDFNPPGPPSRKGLILRRMIVIHP